MLLWIRYLEGAKISPHNFFTNNKEENLPMQCRALAGHHIKQVIKLLHH